MNTDLAGRPTLPTRSARSATSCAASTCSATLRTPPSPTRTRSGPDRPRTPSAASSTRRTSPATRALAAVPGEAAAEHLRLFRNGVNAGLSQIRRIPGGSKVRQPPGLLLLECLKNREADVLRFLTDTAIPPTSASADYGPWQGPRPAMPRRSAASDAVRV